MALLSVPPFVARWPYFGRPDPWRSMDLLSVPLFGIQWLCFRSYPYSLCETQHKNHTHEIPEKKPSTQIPRTNPNERPSTNILPANSRRKTQHTNPIHEFPKKELAHKSYPRFPGERPGTGMSRYLYRSLSLSLSLSLPLFLSLSLCIYIYIYTERERERARERERCTYILSQNYI